MYFLGGKGVQCEGLKTLPSSLLIGYLGAWTSWNPHSLSRDWLYLWYNWINFKVKGKTVKQSRNRPGVAQRVPGGLGSQISWHSAHEGGEVGRLIRRPPLLAGNVPGTHFHQGLSRPQGHGAAGRKYVIEKSSDTTGKWSRDRPTSIAAP